MKANKFISEWNRVKENKGTINKCLVDFRNSCLLSKESDFTKFCISLFGDKTNKVLNGEYYSEIKNAYKIGETVSYTKKDGAIIQYTRKCSEWDVFKYFYNLWEKANNK